MAVTYEDAMDTLCGMFGSVDKEVVAMILQANGGHMEKTVENLLAMTGGGGASAEPPRRQSVQQPQQQPPPHNRRESYNEHKSGPQPPQRQQQHQQPPIDEGANDVYRLPDDFMRPPSYFSTILNASPEQAQARPPQRKTSSVEEIQSQIDQDHLLAEMLMNEQFMADLANNPERYGEPSQSQPPQQLPASQQPQSRRAAPPAHPFPEHLLQQAEQESRSRAGSLAAPPPNAFAASSSSAGLQSVPPTAALASPLIQPSSSPHRNSIDVLPLPLNDKLKSIEQGSNIHQPDKEKQSSFKAKWESLTSAAKEKLARLSQKFKKDSQGEDMGSDYQEMSSFNDDSSNKRKQSKAGAAASSSDAISFISAEDAADLQASYNPPQFRSVDNKKRNAFTVDDGEEDPFGRGANGSEDEQEEDRLDKFLPRTPSLSQNQAAGEEDSRKPFQRAQSSSKSFSQSDMLPGSIESSQSIQPERVFLNSSMFPSQRSGSLSGSSDTPSELAAASRSKERRSIGGGKKPELVAPPSDDDEDEEEATPQQLAKRAQKERSMPLLQEM